MGGGGGEWQGTGGELAGIGAGEPITPSSFLATVSRNRLKLTAGDAVTNSANTAGLTPGGANPLKERKRRNSQLYHLPFFYGLRPVA